MSKRHSSTTVSTGALVGLHTTATASASEMNTHVTYLYYEGEPGVKQSHGYGGHSPIQTSTPSMSLNAKPKAMESTKNATSQLTVSPNTLRSRAG